MSPHRRQPLPRSRSDPRVDAPLDCRHFGTCGGCSRLDQPIRWQLREKVEACEALLGPLLDGRPIGHREARRPPQGFRTRLLWPAKVDRQKLPVVGLYTPRTNDVVRLEECRTMDRWLFAFGQAAAVVLRELKLAPWRPRSGKGFLKALWARLASGSGEVTAGVVTRPGVFAVGRELAERFAAAAAALPRGRSPRALVGVVHSISERDDDFMLGDRHVPLRGRDHVVDRRDGLTFRVSAGSFYQIHAGAHELLYREALRLCGDVAGLRVVDGYGGVGGFGLRLAKAGAREVTIVEDNAAACRDAEHNVTANGLAGVEVARASFAKAAFAEEPDLLVVDPPRAGLREAGVARVLAARPRRLLHVACDATSLARDLRALRGGYALQEIRICDLFPHTEHVELLAMLTRR